MSANNIVGTILIRDNTLLPAGFVVETETLFPGWRAVRHLDGYELGRRIQKANWTFFYLAGAVRTIVLGRKGQKSVRRAIRQSVAKLNGKRFNSVEITGIAARHFLGIPFVSLTAHSRHIQKSLYLVTFEARASRITGVAAPGTKVDSREARPREELLTKANAALV